jgi:hypothetical protein
MFSVGSHFVRYARCCVLGSLVHFTETTNGGSDGGGGCGRVHPGSSSDDALTSLARPDSDAGSLHGILSAECAGIFAVLGDFNLLHHLTEGSTITGSILSGDSNLLGTLGLKVIKKFLN